MSARIEVTLHVEQEDDIPVRGNAMASGDWAVDREVEDEILERLDRGDVWAWASVKVTATLWGPKNDKLLTASVYLGGCSYKDEADFRADGYFADMAKEARDEVKAKFTDIQSIDINSL